jgi:hypothetical protein
VQVPTATAVIVPPENVQDPTGLAETEILTVPPDGATALIATVASIPKSLNVEGVSVGSFARRDEVCKIDAPEEGEDLELSPTMFVATTFTVYVPGVTFSNSIVDAVVVCVAASVFPELIK